MTMTTTAVADRVSGSLQTLIDSRLDTIDRMLLGRVPRGDRLAIVREVESQIFELLGERGPMEGLGRDDVLAVLAGLDPPEAYLPEGEDVGPVSAPGRPSAVSARHARKADPKVAKVGGILGLSGLGLMLLAPVVYIAAGASGSEVFALFLLFGTAGLIFVVGLLGVVLAVYSRLSGAWGVVGLVTGILSLLFSAGAGLLLLLEIG